MKKKHIKVVATDNTIEPITKNRTRTRRLTRNNVTHLLSAIDLHQNTAFRDISFKGFKSSVLNGLLYMRGSLMVIRNDFTGEFECYDWNAENFDYLGIPRQLNPVPLFNTTPPSHRVFINGINAVLWYDTPVFFRSGKPRSRMFMNRGLLNYMQQIVDKMGTQLEISGERLTLTNDDPMAKDSLEEELDELLSGDKLGSVLTTSIGRNIDPALLSFKPAMLEYMQLLSDVNEFRQFGNGFGTGNFGNFKKERSLTSEVTNNEDTCKLILRARKVLDDEFIKDMQDVFNETVTIKYNLDIDKSATDGGKNDNSKTNKNS